MRPGLPCLILLLTVVGPVTSQAAVADTSPFRPLDLPAPTAYRSASGRPGPQYWQQRVDYSIQAALDVQQQKLSGKGIIRYTNNSPDTLTYLWFHVEQNICAQGSIAAKLNQPPLIFQESAFDFSCKGFPGGLTMQPVRSNGRELRSVVDGTIMRVDLAAPLSPKGIVQLELDWSFGIPEYGAGRMGRDGPLYEIAQWYPRLAVYDDVRGWNHEPYIGAGEFYLEYGAFEVAITVPAAYIVAATGRLTNPGDVLTATQRERLARAVRSEQPVAIISADEIGQPASRPRTTGTLTWRFAADRVRDFAFAAAPNWRWDASGYNGIQINTLYRTSAPLWTEANKMARAAIQHFSERWFPYPYPHATTVEGLIEGMEYPMLTFVPKGASREDLQWVLSHEFGHEWYPMIVGSNERLYPWMDEGFNTFIDIEGAELYFAGTPYADTVSLINLHLYPAHSKPGEEQPLINRPIEVRDLFWGGYRKPALMMHLLRHEVLGKERFDFAFREYTRVWAFKHPTPADFFRILRDASGVELDWFWRGWIYTTARLDQAVDNIETREGGGSIVLLSNRAQMLMPAELRLTFADGATETVRLPVDMWNLGTRFTYRVPGTRRVTRAELDPRGVYPDIDRANNRWPR
ncbi:MAG: M1 family metallopeptidase [Gemmatimonadota bacterium]